MTSGITLTAVIKKRHIIKFQPWSPPPLHFTREKKGLVKDTHNQLVSMPDNLEEFQLMGNTPPVHQKMEGTSTLSSGRHLSISLRTSKRKRIEWLKPFHYHKWYYPKFSWKASQKSKFNASQAKHQDNMRWRKFLKWIPPWGRINLDHKSLPMPKGDNI